jgi:hypothetical protein
LKLDVHSTVKIPGTIFHQSRTVVRPSILNIDLCLEDLGSWWEIYEKFMEVYLSDLWRYREKKSRIYFFFFF